MNMLNSIILEGNVIKTGTLERQHANINQIEFTIGVERHYINLERKDVNEISEFSIVGYGNLAEFFAENKNKVGQGVRVVGRLKQIKWLDGDKECSRVVIIAEHIEYKPAKRG